MREFPGTCSREDSNLHGLPHTILSRMRLPVPPREQSKGVKIARGAMSVNQKMTDFRLFYLRSPSQSKTKAGQNTLQTL